ncbi:Ovochymase-1 [Bulinus truncatus]|nr:Ovochymase-1 [Bulinus truncatus]
MLSRSSLYMLLSLVQWLTAAYGCLPSKQQRTCETVKRPMVQLDSYQNIYLRLRAPTKQGRLWREHPTPASLNTSGNYSDLCGLPSFDVDHSVFNGSDAPDMAWPWQVLIKGERKLCSGVLISDLWILTVAHCFNSTRSLVLGRTDLERWTPSAVERKAALEIAHANYNTVTKESDIGLIKLSRAVEFNNHVRPICVYRAPPSEFIYPQKCYVTGWGMRNPKDRQLTKHLKQLRVNVMPHGYCRFLWSLKGVVIHSGHICLDFNTTAPSGGVCSGDSGGPLNCKMNGRYFLFGLGSFVEKGCMKTLLPDVFTRLSDYTDWIDTTINSYT